MVVQMKRNLIQIKTNFVSTTLLRDVTWINKYNAVIVQNRHNPYKLKSFSKLSQCFVPALSQRDYTGRKEFAHSDIVIRFVMFIHVVILLLLLLFGVGRSSSYRHYI